MDRLARPSSGTTRRLTRDDRERRLATATARLAAHLREDELERLAHETEIAEKALARAKSPPASAAVISAVTGRPRRSVGERAALRRQTILRAFAKRRELLADSYSASEVAELLGKVRQTPYDRLRAGTILGAREGGEWRFPAWQFDPAGSDGLVPGLSAVLRVLEIPSEIARVAWFVSKLPSLGGATPLDSLKAGAIEEVLAEARAALPA